jgi:putative cell wall-binding protein
LGGGPVLLVQPTAIPPVIGTELARLKPDRIVIVGGTAAVDSAVGAQLKAYTSGAVSRVAGSDRYGTSAAISATFSANPAVAYVATGENFPDALSGAAVAAETVPVASKTNGGPMLLVQNNSIPPAIATELSQLHPKRIVILGGTSVIGSAVAAQLQAYTTGTITRVAGADRYATSAAVSRATFPAGVAVAYVAVGSNYPDALSGAPAAGMAAGPVLLINQNSIPPVIATELKRLNPGRIVILGGTGAISTTVANAL